MGNNRNKSSAANHQIDCDSGEYNCQFSAIDTWFFRESRPHDAAGASELSSLFPPPVRTLLGAVRSFLGDSININWQAFNEDNASAHEIEGLNFKTAVGDSEGLGQLSVKGVWVNYNNQRLYPVPFYLMHKDKQLSRLQIGDCVHCDLGNVRLPELVTEEAGYKTFEQCWINYQGLQKLLQGKQLPDHSDIISLQHLLSQEARLGIARNNDSRSVIEGQLYQTQHIRTKSNVKIELDIANIDERLLTKPMITESHILRLGSEGRMAAFTIKQNKQQAPTITNLSGTMNKFIIHFISAAYFDGAMFPTGFTKEQVGEQSVWQGTINGIEIMIEAAVIGKVHREGGWDMKKHQPRTVKSYIPAGSAWFCRAVDNTLSTETIMATLHETCIGLEQQWGRGQILIGHWQDNQQGE